MTERKKDKNTDNRQQFNFGHELWGVLYFSLGFLVTVSLVSYRINPSSNILGEYIGTGLARGLTMLLGGVAVYLVPVALFVIATKLWRGIQLSFATLGFWLLLGLEICTLLAISDLSQADKKSLWWPPNAIGHLMVKWLEFFFASHRFGPYFIFSLALLITLCIGFKIDLKTLVRPIAKLLVLAVKWMQGKLNLALKRIIKRTFGFGKQSQADLPAQHQAPKTANEPGEQKRISESERTKEEISEKQKQQLEEELAAFRARQNRPITISTGDILPAEIPSEEEDDDETEDAVLPIELVEPLAATQRRSDSLKRESQRDNLEAKNESEKLIETDAIIEEGATPLEEYRIPSEDILPTPPLPSDTIDKAAIEHNSAILEKTLLNFGLEGKVVNVCPGPVINRYEIELAPGIKVSRIVALQDDISMAVGGQKIRIEAPIPGKAAIGIELPTSQRQIVHFKHILTSDAFTKSKAKLPVVVGRTISGAPFVTDITKMPHLLIAGQTGSGKSVCINSIICSFLMTKKPDELRLIMIDPKKVELSCYEGIPHLLAPVVTESKEAVKALQWGVREMERRYRLLAKVGARNIDSFNSRIASGKIPEAALSEDELKLLPFVVIIVDELADLMITATKDVEGLIQRIAQLARAVGMHLIVATQRPSVDIITGPIKANLTSRIAFRTIQSTDSRTILGHIGAEKLLGMGDMLFLRNGAPDIERFHGAYISEEDVETIVNAIKRQNIKIDKIEKFSDETDREDESNAVKAEDGEHDELFEEAAQIVVSLGQGSTSMLQRRLKIGYARAGRLMDELEQAGIVGPQEGSKMREVLIKPDELHELLRNLKDEKV